MTGTNGKKSRLLFVLLSLGGGGAERVLVNIMNSLDKTKYEVQLVVFEDVPDYQKYVDPSVRLLCLNKKGRGDFLRLIFRLRKVICDYQPEVVLSFTSYINIITVLASLVTNRRFRLIISERNHPRKYLPEFRFGLLRKQLMRFTYQRADNIISVSREIAGVLEEDLGIRPERIKVIYNPILFADIRDNSNEIIRHRFFDNQSSKVIISVGRLETQKRFDVLLEAFSLIRKTHKNAYLIVLGKGRLIEELNNLTVQFDICDCVDFVGFQSNPYAWIKNSDIFALSSDYEGFPNVVLEAMACGVPVVSTDCPSGPSEIITNKKNGILIPPADHKALAEAVISLLDDEALSSLISSGGEKRANDFDIDKILPQYKEVLRI